MGVLDKLMFWKKQDDFSDLGLSSSSGSDPLGKSGSDPFGKPGNDPFSAGSDPFSQHSSGLGNQPDTLNMDAYNPGMPQSQSASSPYSSQQSSPYAPSSHADPFSAQPTNDPMQPRFTQAQSPQTQLASPQQEIDNKNMEIISAKLDALRTTMESINQRLANIESIAKAEEEAEKRKRGRYY